MDKGEEKLCRHLDTEKYPIDSLSRNSHLKERITANRRNILVRFNLTQANPVPEVNDSGNVVYTHDAKGIHSVALGRQLRQLFTAKSGETSGTEIALATKPNRGRVKNYNPNSKAIDSLPRVNFSKRGKTKIMYNKFLVSGERLF
jgi:molecular chaperone DnaK (HSP70)